MQSQLTLDDDFIRARDEFDTSTATAVLIIFWAVLQAHACYSVFFAAYAYHTTTEACLGLAYGLLISVIVFDVPSYFDRRNLNTKL